MSGSAAGGDAIVVGRDGTGRPLLAAPRLDMPGLFEWREGASVRLFRLEAGAQVVEVTEERRASAPALKARLKAGARALRQELTAKRAQEAAMQRAAEEGAALRATRERRRHDEVLALPRAPFDECGPESRPQRVADRWIRMARDGMIDGAGLRAAHQFRRDFAVAGLERLHAASLELKVDGSMDAEPRRAEVQIEANDALWEALRALGGLGRPSGSIVYACVGLERTVKEWCWQQAASAGRYGDEKRASGILIGALVALGAHYLHRDARDEVRARFRAEEKRGGGRSSRVDKRTNMYD